MTPTRVDQLPDDPAALKRMVIERQAALAGRQLQIERECEDLLESSAGVEGGGFGGQSARHAAGEGSVEEQWRASFGSRIDWDPHRPWEVYGVSDQLS